MTEYTAHLHILKSTVPVLLQVGVCLGMSVISFFGGGRGGKYPLPLVSVGEVFQ